MIESLKLLQIKDKEFIEENNEDFYYFYQCSTGENLFLHNVSMKLFN